MERRFSKETGAVAVVIRPAGREDAAHFPAIERDSGRAFLAAPGLEWIATDEVMSAEAHLPAIDTGLVWVAEREPGVPCGFLSAEACEGGVWHVWQISVASGEQGRGIGRRLMEDIEARARERGAMALTLTTFRELPWNERFYASLGFTTLNEAQLDARLRAILQNEARHGLPAERRCAMRKVL